MSLGGFGSFGWVWVSLDRVGWVWVGLAGFGWVWLGLARLGRFSFYYVRMRVSMGKNQENEKLQLRDHPRNTTTL